jgi:cytochrome c oxidase subunit 3
MSSGAGAHEATGSAPYYFVPAPSKWPMVGAIAMTFFGLGLASWFNDAPWGPYLFAIFCAILAYMMIGWFTEVARESESGLYSKRVDISFRWSMSWFIFSEVMFFAAFFGALFYARTLAMPWLGDLDHRTLLGPISPPSGRTSALPGFTSPSRRSARGPSRRSTRRCCSRRASR